MHVLLFMTAMHSCLRHSSLIWECSVFVSFWLWSCWVLLRVSVVKGSPGCWSTHSSFNTFGTKGSSSRRYLQTSAFVSGPRTGSTQHDPLRRCCIIHHLLGTETGETLLRLTSSNSWTTGLWSSTACELHRVSGALRPHIASEIINKKMQHFECTIALGEPDCLCKDKFAAGSEEGGEKNWLFPMQCCIIWQENNDALLSRWGQKRAPCFHPTWQLGVHVHVLQRKSVSVQ